MSKITLSREIDVGSRCVVVSGPQVDVTELERRFQASIYFDSAQVGRSGAPSRIAIRAVRVRADSVLLRFGMQGLIPTIPFVRGFFNCRLDTSYGQMRMLVSPRSPLELIPIPVLILIFALGIGCWKIGAAWIFGSSLTVAAGSSAWTAVKEREFVSAHQIEMCAELLRLVSGYEVEISLP